MQGKAPKYQQVADTVARQIHDGTFPVGTLLPTETELSALFEVSRHTIRHGLRELRARGLVASRQGRGSEVTAVGAMEMGSATSYELAEFLDSPFNWRLRIEMAKTIVAGVGLSPFLECAPQTRLLQVSGVFVSPNSENDQPSAPVSLYVDELFSGFFSAFDGSKPHLPQLLADAYGLRIKRIVQDLAMEPVDGGYGNPAGKVIINRRYYAMDDKVFLFLRGYCPPSAFSIVSRRENTSS